MLKILHWNTFYFLRYAHWIMWKVCLQTFRNNRICKKLAYSLGIYKLHGQITQEFLGLRIRNFQGIVFTWTQTHFQISHFQICISIPFTILFLIQKIYFRETAKHNFDKATDGHIWFIHSFIHSIFNIVWF